MTMVCAQVMGNNTTITFSGALGQFELNVFKPVMAYNLLNSIRLLGDACQSFRLHCVDSIKANKEKIDKVLNESLMLVTALNPKLDMITLRRQLRMPIKRYYLKGILFELELLTSEEFDEWVRPENDWSKGLGWYVFILFIGK